MGLGSPTEFMVQAGEKAVLALEGGGAGFDPRRRPLYSHPSVSEEDWAQDPHGYENQGCLGPFNKTT